MLQTYYLFSTSFTFPTFTISQFVTSIIHSLTLIYHFFAISYHLTRLKIAVVTLRGAFANSFSLTPFCHPSFKCKIAKLASLSYYELSLCLLPLRLYSSWWLPLLAFSIPFCLRVSIFLSFPVFSSHSPHQPGSGSPFVAHFNSPNVVLNMFLLKATIIYFQPACSGATFRTHRLALVLLVFYRVSFLLFSLPFISVVDSSFGFPAVFSSLFLRLCCCYYLPETPSRQSYPLKVLL